MNQPEGDADERAANAPQPQPDRPCPSSADAPDWYELLAGIGGESKTVDGELALL